MKITKDNHITEDNFIWKDLSPFQALGLTIILLTIFIFFFVTQYHPG